jgi:hypothetical protein
MVNQAQLGPDPASRTVRSVRIDRSLPYAPRQHDRIWGPVQRLNATNKPELVQLDTLLDKL